MEQGVYRELFAELAGRRPGIRVAMNMLVSWVIGGRFLAAILEASEGLGGQGADGRGDCADGCGDGRKRSGHWQG